MVKTLFWIQLGGCGYVRVREEHEGSTFGLCCPYSSRIFWQIKTLILSTIPLPLLEGDFKESPLFLDPTREWRLCPNARQEVASSPSANGLPNMHGNELVATIVGALTAHHAIRSL